MEEHGVPPLRPHPIRPFWPDRDTDVLVFDLEALYPLLEALGATAVGLPLGHCLDMTLIIS